MSSEGSPPEAADAGEAVATLEVDELRQGLRAVLREELGDAVVADEVAGGDITVRVDRAAWVRAAQVCRDRLHTDYFCFLSGIDWKSAPELSGEKVWDPDVVATDDDAPAELRTGVAGGESRFQVFARLYSTRRHVGITLKADLDEAAPSVGSWTELYRGADWHERETWEMFGFHFEGHPGLRHLYLPGEFEGHPLRKDFPLLAREVKPWPGLVDVEPMPGEPEGEGDGEAAEGGDA